MICDFWCWAIFWWGNYFKFWGKGPEVLCLGVGLYLTISIVDIWSLFVIYERWTAFRDGWMVGTLIWFWSGNIKIGLIRG